MSVRIEDIDFEFIVDSIINWENKYRWDWPETALLSMNLKVSDNDHATIKDILCKMKLFVIDDNGALTDPSRITDDNGILNINKHFWPNFLDDPDDEVYQIGDKIEYVKLAS